MKNIALVVTVLLIGFIIGWISCFDTTMKEMRPYAGDEGIIVIDVYGQEYVYEE